LVKAETSLPWVALCSSTQHKSKLRRRESYTEICLTRCVFFQKNTRP